MSSILEEQTDGRRDGEAMDIDRRKRIAHEYLVRIGEAKEWIEACIDEDLPPTVDMEDALTNGVYLAKLARFFAPKSIKKIYDEKQEQPLNLRHSDNFNAFRVASLKAGLPLTYFFELTDLYDKKNMPRVIYMLHALSHYLAKKGIAPKINNLMGQLFFTDEELEQASKNLGNLQMPSFGDLNASLDKELGLPVSENEQIRREVRESQASYEGRVIALLEWTAKATEQTAQPVAPTLTQGGLSQARTAFDEFMSSDYTPHDTEKKSILAFFTEINTKLESHDMGSYEVDPKFAPANIEKVWGELDAAIAARRAALDYHARRFKYEKDSGEFCEWVTDAISRQNNRDFAGRSSKEVNAAIEQQAAFASGEKATRHGQLDDLTGVVTSLASEPTYAAPAGRSADQLRENWSVLEAAERARNEELQRQLEYANRREAYEGKADAFTERLRAQARAYDDRSFPEVLASVNELLSQLPGERAKIEGERSSIAALQGESDGITSDFKYSAPIGKSIPDLEEVLAQTLAAVNNRERALLEKKRLLEDAARAQHFKDNESTIEQLQANLRGYLGRKHHQERMALLKEKEPLWEKIQAIAKGNAVRRQIRDMKAYYGENTDKVTKAQAIFRGKIARDHYKALTGLDNPPARTVQRFLYLLDESEKDFDEELELERLKQLVVQGIRANSEREVELNHLDIKIALLIRNRASLEEIVESTKKYLKQQKKAEAGDHALNLRLLDKDSRHRLEGYQHLFYLLQTEPHYLAKLMTELSSKESTLKFVETVVLTLYGYAQNAREEYLLLKLFHDTLKREISHVTDEQEILRGNPVFIKLVVHYTRGARERQFLRELLQPLVKEILERDDLDLDVDPLSIYRMLIREEESRTGQLSTKPYDVSRSQAVESEEVMKIFVKRLKDLRGMTEKFLSAIIASLPNMPYGIRYIARELAGALRERFPDQPEEKSIKTVGHLIYYRYMNPAIVAPEGFDVIEQVISSNQRKNLGEISKMLLQISVNRLYDDEAFYLSALNEYITSANARFSKFFRDVINVPSSEEHFMIDRYDDSLKITKPIVYLSSEEIFKMHGLLVEYSDEVAGKESNDKLRVILGELGAPPALPSDGQGNSQEISLTLTNRFSEFENEEDAKVKTTFMQVKRSVLIVLGAQKGKDLLEILESPVTDEMEKAYQQRRQEEDAVRNTRAGRTGGPLKKSESHVDFSNLSLKDLKAQTLTQLAYLEKAKVVSRANKYQDILNSIAKDMRNKNRRRIQRRAELIKMRQTLSHLEEKATYLNSQKQSYQDYVNSCIGTMKDKSKRSRKRTVLPFTRQYNHMQKMKREGKVFAFGSFSYTADRLFQKGVLVDLEGIPESQRSRVSLTISSDETGVFAVEGKFLGIAVDQAIEIRLDDLLQKQFDNIQIMNLGIAKVNVNLLIFLINKKFFK